MGKKYNLLSHSVSKFSVFILLYVCIIGLSLSSLEVFQSICLWIYLYRSEIVLSNSTFLLLFYLILQIFYISKAGTNYLLDYVFQLSFLLVLICPNYSNPNHVHLNFNFVEWTYPMIYLISYCTSWWITNVSDSYSRLFGIVESTVADVI